MQKKINKEEIIFIAGSQGMAGSAINRMLKKEGYGDENIGGKILCPSRKELDLLDPNQVNKWFKKNKPSIVVLAAAKVGGILANLKYPAEFILNNLKIQTNVIENSWKNNVKRFLFLGSSCIYPKFSEQPIREESLLNGRLESTNEYYAIAKIAGIKLCQSLNKQYNFDAISLMPTNLYGPGDNYHPETSHVMASLIMKFINAKRYSAKFVQCWGTGKPFREFLHADDLGRAVVFALENWDPNDSYSPNDLEGNKLYHLNVGTGKEISIFELAHKISKAVGYKGQIIWDSSKPDGTPRKLLDISRIKDLGWSPSISLEKGLNKVISEIKGI